ncbi:hypothetical protein [Marinobacter sp. DUT-1]|uniref:hypothetical protein n=1 Tax=Marinobacter sp. DUT-1 TaxID=3412037 RepID=UPI003D16EFBB
MRFVLRLLLLSAVSLPGFAAPFYAPASANYYFTSDQWFDTEQQIGDAIKCKTGGCPDLVDDNYAIVLNDTRTLYIDGVRYGPLPYKKLTVYVIGKDNPSAYYYDFEGVENPPAPCDPPNYEDPDTGACLSPKAPEECEEIGEFYNPDNSQCVTTCPSGGSLGTYCLTQPDPACSPSSPDYQGTAGWGDDHRYVCSGETSCGTGESYAFREMDDGSWSGVCVSDESNPPVCPGGFESVLEIYDDGFACGNLNEDKEDPTRNDSSNGDSDGDGVADDTGMAGQLEDIKGLLKDGNNERSNIGQSIKKGFGDLKDAISNLPGGGGGDSGTGKTEIVGEDGNAITWSGSPIAMEVQDGLNELNAVQGEYETLIGNIRSEMAASFGSFTGAGGLQDNNITLFGQTFNAGLSKFGADLSMIGSIILFAATFAALGIIMGARD